MIRHEMKQVGERPPSRYDMRHSRIIVDYRLSQNEAFFACEMYSMIRRMGR